MTATPMNDNMKKLEKLEKLESPRFEATNSSYEKHDTFCLVEVYFVVS